MTLITFEISKSTYVGKKFQKRKRVFRRYFDKNKI